MPKKLFAGLAAAALIALMAASAQAAEKAAEDKAAADAAKLGLPVVSYYPLAPEIVTNYTASPGISGMSGSARRLLSPTPLTLTR